MGQRVVRVNELVKREISDILHTRYQGEAVYITITEVRTSPDLRNADVFYAVLGGEIQSYEANEFFARVGSDVRQILSRRIVLKYLPQLHFHEDDSIARGMEINAMLDDLGLEGESAPPPPEDDDQNQS